MPSRTSMLFIVILCLIYSCLFIPIVTSQAQPLTNALDGIVVKRVHIPRECPIRIEHNYHIVMHYKGYLIDPETNEVDVDSIFDETKGYRPASMQANPRAMLPSLYRGLLGTCIGEHRTIQIEPQYAYGEDGFGNVPGNTSVLFSVQILSITPFTDTFDAIDTDMSGCITIEELTRWVIQSGKVPTHQVESTAERLFKHQDKNNDGFIECDELLTTNKNCDIIISCIAPPEPEPEPEPEAEAEGEAAEGDTETMSETEDDGVSSRDTTTTTITEAREEEETSIAEFVDGDEHMIESNADGDEIATA